jgi:hypothetical protein
MLSAVVSIASQGYLDSALPQTVLFLVETISQFAEVKQTNSSSYSPAADSIDGLVR